MWREKERKVGTESGDGEEKRATETKAKYQTKREVLREGVCVEQKGGPWYYVCVYIGRKRRGRDSDWARSLPFTRKETWNEWKCTKRCERSCGFTCTEKREQLVIRVFFSSVKQCYVCVCVCVCGWGKGCKGTTELLVLPHLSACD